MQRNDRVRPISCLSGKQHEEGSEHKSKHGMLFSGENTDVDEEKFNIDMIHDLDEVRHNVKDALRKIEEKKILEAEKAEKQRKKNKWCLSNI